MLLLVNLNIADILLILYLSLWNIKLNFYLLNPNL